MFAWIGALHVGEVTVTELPVVLRRTQIRSAGDTALRGAERTVAS
ncbi:MAG: hypothetical protein ACHQZQ_07990 [SAR324 cluster bacterium]